MLVNIVMMLNPTYQGRLLAAHPNNPKDSLHKSVILVVNHSELMSIGLQLNRPVTDLTLQTVAETIGIWYEGDDVVYSGGNVGPNKIHVVHSMDWHSKTTVRLNDEIGVTNDISVLMALSRNEGPEFFRACAGYRFWDMGMLDKEIQARGTDHAERQWETAPATIENIFCYHGAGQWSNTVNTSVASQINNWF